MPPGGGIGPMDDVGEFLAAHPPFAGLPPDVLPRVVEAVRSVRFQRGESILSVGGPPAVGLFLIRSGSVELLDGGLVVDSLERGEAFGFPSMLTDEGPFYDVRAVDETECLLLPRAVAEDVLGSPSGLRFLAHNLRARVRSAPTRSSSMVLTAVPARVLVKGPVVVIDASTSVADVARAMTHAGVTAAVVRMADQMGIVTDWDIRARVVAEGRSPDDPVGAVASFPVHAVDGEAPVSDILVEMVDGGFGHVPVLDAVGGVAGILAESDLLGLNRRDPTGVRVRLTEAGTPHEVATAMLAIPEVAVTLHDAGLETTDVARVTTSLVDASARRLLELAIGEIGEPPVAWAWLALGSAARRELALSADQDHTLVWDGGSEHDVYFGRIAEFVTAGLEAGGLARCASKVMATVPGWRCGLGTWLERQRSWIRDPLARSTFLITIAFDVRQVSGPLDAEGPAREIIAGARGSPAFLHRLAGLATELKPPLGFRGNLVVQRKGDARGVLDVKAAGLLATVDLARYAAVRAGVVAPETLTRLRQAGAAGSLDSDSADALAESFMTFAEIRLEHQVARVRAGETPDNLIDPSTLDSLTRSRLREAFRIVGQVQRELGRGGTSRLG
jgi:CBS domain-containing protein